MQKDTRSGWCTRDPARVMYDLDWPNRSRRRVGDKRAPIYIGNPAAKLRGERSRFIGAICIIVKVFGIGSDDRYARNSSLSLSLSLSLANSIDLRYLGI